MPNIIRDLPVVTFSSGATNSPAIGGFDDATVVGLFLTTAQTATGTQFQIQVEPTDTGTNFLALSFFTSGAAPVVLLASQYIPISPIHFRQVRLTATAAVNNGLGVGGLKQITV